MRIRDIHARLYHIGKRIERVQKSPTTCMDEGTVIMDDAPWMLRLCNALLDKVAPNTRLAYYPDEPERDAQISEVVQLDDSR